MLTNSPCILQGHQQGVASVASVVQLLLAPQPLSDASRSAKVAVTDGEDDVRHQQ